MPNAYNTYRYPAAHFLSTDKPLTPADRGIQLDN